MQRRDARTDESPVYLELALALAEAAPDPASGLLAHQVAPHAAQARQYVLELGELDLEAALVRLGVHAKDVEDEGRAVDDLDGLADEALEVCLLRGRELVVEYDHVCIEGMDGRDEFLDLALADERLGDRGRRAAASW